MLLYVYNEIFTRLNGIFTHLGRMDLDFFYLCHVCTYQSFAENIFKWAFSSIFKKYFYKNIIEICS